MIIKTETIIPSQNCSQWHISSNGWYPYCSRCGHEPENGIMSNFCPDCGSDMRKPLKPAISEDKHIFVITVFEKCEPDGRGFANVGNMRSPGFRYSFEEAEKAVKFNMCDIWEHCYNYAVIHEIGPELYPLRHMRKFYKFNKDIDGYEPIDEPNCLSFVDFCGIG